ncbi:MAG: acyl-CoA thioesterase [Ferrovibrio sp.]|jgi:acyl-CoA thioester hydrolase|nr:acyl-CoA thioesterase [Ferrovibrio sp.]
MTDRYVETLRLMAQAWHCDHLGHVNVSHYMGWLGDAAFAFLAMHGLDRARSAEENLGVAAVRAEIDYQAELRGGDLVRMETGVETIAERKIVFRHRLVRVGDDRIAMAARLTGVCLDLNSRRARAFPAAFASGVASAFGLPTPGQNLAQGAAA